MVPADDPPRAEAQHLEFTVGKDAVAGAASTSELITVATSTTGFDLRAAHLPLCLLNSDRVIVWRNTAFDRLVARSGDYRIDECLAPGETIEWPIAAQTAFEKRVLDAVGTPRSCELRLLGSGSAAEFPGAELLLLFDVSDRHDREEIARAVQLEMAHRMRNLVSVIIALVNDALAHAPDADAVADLIDRLRSLEAAGYAGDDVDGDRCAVRSLLRRILARFHDPDDGRIVFDIGDEIVSRRVGSTLALVVHELATNALKYGALSNRAGQVHLRCCQVADALPPRLHLHWRETGGPAAKPPDRLGYGLSFIQRIVEHAKGGSVRFRFPPTGINCEIDLTITDL